MDIKQQAIDKLSNSMRIYNEECFRFPRLKAVDLEEAVNNLDRAFEAKLEAFHSLHDVTKSEFEYFKDGDTALLLVIRNAIHHRTHNLFNSWNKMMLKDGIAPHKGKTLLFVSNRLNNDREEAKYFYKLEDILLRLDSKLDSPALDKYTKDSRREANLEVISETLDFESIFDYSRSEGIPDADIYINIIPIFISAVAKVFSELKASGIEFIGYDAEVYGEHFNEELKGVSTFNRYYNLVLIKE